MVYKKELIGIFNKELKRFKLDYHQENGVLFLLDGGFNLIKSELLFKGGIRSCIFDIRTVINSTTKNSSFVIFFAHNHPGQKNPKLSGNDLDCFVDAKYSLKMLKIDLVDVFVFNEKGITDFFNRDRCYYVNREVL